MLGRVLGIVAAGALMLAVSLVGGVYLWLHESVAAVSAHSADVKAAQTTLDGVPPADKAAIALVIGYDRRHGEAEGTAVALRHAHAPPRRPADGLDLDAVVPARSRGRGAVPGLGLHSEDQRRVLDLRREGRARHRPQHHRAADQLPHHRELQRLQAHRQHARRRLGGRRSPLLQRQRGCQPGLRLREGQPPAGLPAADRRCGARLREVPTYGLGLPPHRAAAAVRDRDEGAVRARVLGDEGAAPRRRGDEERRGRRRRRQGADRAHDSPLRALRLRPSGRAASSRRRSRA